MISDWVMYEHKVKKYTPTKTELAKKMMKVHDIFARMTPGSPLEFDFNVLARRLDIQGKYNLICHKELLNILQFVLRDKFKIGLKETLHQ